MATNLQLIRQRQRFLEIGEQFMLSQEGNLLGNIVYILMSLCQIAETTIKQRQRGSDRSAAVKQIIRKKITVIELPDAVLDAHIRSIVMAMQQGLRPDSKWVKIGRFLCMLF